MLKLVKTALLKTVLFTAIFMVPSYSIVIAASSEPDRKPESVSDTGSKPYHVPWEDKFDLPPLDSEGWSILSPSGDSRLIYVSDTEGNDLKAKIYSPSSPAIGANPQNPKGPVFAYKTINAALEQSRRGFPDWVLLKRGDTWKQPDAIQMRSGRSKSEYSVLTSYGQSQKRPVIKTEKIAALSIWVDIKFSALTGVKFYAYKRDPGAAEFAGFNFDDAKRPSVGINSFSAENGGIHSILIEDCVFSFYTNNVIHGSSVTRNFAIRRSQFSNNYGTLGHAQGLFSSKSSLLLEENLFDHNGWFQQKEGNGSNINQGQATLFNHNIYLDTSENMIIRGNIFSRASSMGIKLTANAYGPADSIISKNILIDNNLFIEGEIGISAGGNKDNNTGYRWQSMHIVNNVLVDIGHARPTNRSLAWGIEANDWDGGIVSGNYLLNYGMPGVGNVEGIRVRGHVQNTEISNNVLYGLSSDFAQFLIYIKDGNKKNVKLLNNEMSLVKVGKMGFVSADALADVGYDGNVYFSDNTTVGKSAGVNDDNKGILSALIGKAKGYISKRGDDGKVGGNWKIGKSGFSYPEWISKVSEKNATNTMPKYIDPGRAIEAYQESLGKEATLQAFLEETKKQSKLNWQNSYTATSVNSYIKIGFCTSDCD